MVQANIGKDLSGRIVVSFPWHPAEKHWSFPNTDSILEKILKVFGDKEVQIDPALQANLPKTSSGDNKAKQEQSQFEDLRRELVYCKISIWKKVTLTKFECGGPF